MEPLYIENTNFEILTSNGFKSFTKLKKLKKPTLKFYFKNCEITITISTDHIFYYDDSGRNTKLACEFKEGEWLSHTKYGFVCIDKIIKSETTTVYDIVDVNNENHSYITSGFNSHNCEFHGASNTLITSSILLNLNSLTTVIPVTTQHNGCTIIYEEPIQGTEYIIGVDPAEGVNKDYFVVQVLKINVNTTVLLEQVATYRSNNVPLEKTVQIAISIAKYYNNAWAMVENNNACGGLATHFMWYTYEYENMVNPDKAKKNKLGINANVKSKYQANIKLRTLLDNFQLKLVDPFTIQELNSYEEIKPNIWAAGNSTVHDDMVTSLLWAVMFLESNNYVNFKSDYGTDISEEFTIAPPAFRTSNKARTY